MRLVDNGQIVSLFLPLDLGTARAGDWVSLKNFAHATVIFFKGAGTAGDDPTITLQQASAVAGTGAKALTFTHIYKKQNTALTTEGVFTDVSQSASETYTDATSAEDAAIWVIEIDADELDVDSGFDCLRVSCDDVGSNAQLGCALVILTEPRNARAAANMQSAIVD